MPHILVQCYPGRDDEKKTRLAQALAKTTAEIFGADEKSISVAIQDIPREEWEDRVQKPEIEGRAELLYKKPE